MRGLRGLAAAAVLVGLVGCAGDDSPPAPADGDAITAEQFLDTYVDRDGRVVRRDQGGDTVSEGQAYAMLIAVHDRDQQTFDAAWQWTQDNLAREDGLYSWRWADGEVVDDSSASDAELDMARALLIAWEVFGDQSYRDEAVELGDAVLDHLTVPVPEGRLVVAGQWATRPPYVFNPSYVAPVTFYLLGEASGDPRWDEVTTGSRAALEALAEQAPLPPDWAEVDADGSVRATASPDGEVPVGYSYDAARTPVRLGESCHDADRELAAAIADTVAASGRAASTYDLQGTPRDDLASPLVSVGQSLGLEAGGDSDGADAAYALAVEQQRAAPTYYGDAWTVLGGALRTDVDLRGCSAS